MEGVRTSNHDRSRGSKRWLGRTEFLTLTIQSEPRLESANQSTRAKWRFSLSACGRVRRSCLTLPTLLEMAMLRQSTPRRRQIHLDPLLALYSKFPLRLIERLFKRLVPSISDLAVLRDVEQVAAVLVWVAGDFQSDEWCKFPRALGVTDSVFGSSGSQMLGT